MKLALSILLCGALAASAQTLNVSGTANIGTLTQYTLDTNVAVLWVSTNWLNFGANLTNVTNDVSFTVSNAGTATLVGGVTNNSPFSWVGMSNYTLAPNGSSNLTIRYTRGAVGSDTNELGLTGGGGTNVHLSGSATNPAGVGTFYFGSSGTNSATQIAFWLAAWIVGDDVTATTGGSLKKIGCKVLESADPAATNGMSISLYKFSGGNWILHECKDFILAAGWSGWTNVTLTTPLTISDGETVRVVYTCVDTAGSIAWYGGSELTGGYRDTITWATRCDAPNFSSDEHAGACVYVE